MRPQLAGGVDRRRRHHVGDVGGLVAVEPAEDVGPVRAGGGGAVEVDRVGVGGALVVLGGGDDPRHGLHRRQRVAARRRLAGEHQGVGAVEHRVGDVGGLGAGGAGLLHHRFEHLGGDDHRPAEAAAGGDDPLLQHRHPVDRHLDAEVAARHHHRVGGGDDLVEVVHRPAALELGDERDRRRRSGRPAGLADRPAQRREVGGAADVARRQVVDPLGDGEGDVGAVLVGDREAEVAVGEVDPLAAPHLAAGDHPRRHPLAAPLADRQLDQPLVDQHPLAGAEEVEEPGLVHRQLDAGSGRAEVDRLARLERPRREIRRQPEAGPHQVEHHRDVAPGRVGGLAHQPDALAVPVVGAVREVEADDVDAGVDQVADGAGLRGRRAEGGDDLGAAVHRRRV